MSKKPKFGVVIWWGGFWDRTPDTLNLDKRYHTPPAHFKDIKKVGKSNKKICTVKGH